MVISPRTLSLKYLLTLALVGLMYVVVLLAVIELGYTIVRDLLTPPLFLLGLNQLLEILSLFLLVLVAIELLETVSAFLRENILHVEVVFEAALIAVARKIILLDTEKMDAGSIAALAAVILAMSIGFYVIKTSFRLDGEEIKNPLARGNSGQGSGPFPS